LLPLAELSMIQFQKRSSKAPPLRMKYYGVGLTRTGGHSVSSRHWPP